MRVHERSRLRILMSVSGGLILLAGACSKQPQAEQPDQSSVVPAKPDPGSAYTPDPAKGPRLVKECLSAYAECAPVIGVPALSADNTRVAVPDFGPDSGRDQLILTVRVLDIQSNATVSELPILTYADYDQGMDPTTGALPPELQGELDRRIQAFDRLMAEGQYRPLTFLGKVYEDHPGNEVDGLRAVFDGKELAVTDVRAGMVRWQRAIGPSKTWKPMPEGDLVCGPFPVADVSVWVSREPSVIVAYVTYIGSDLCATEYPYLVWR